MPEKAKTLKKKADKGYDATDSAMVEDEDDSSGFEDVDSDENEDEVETTAQKEVKAKSSAKKSSMK